jgi:hypothetical protein
MLVRFRTNMVLANITDREFNTGRRGAGEANAMGSVRHPKLYDPVIVESVRDAFHEIMDELNEHYLLRDGDSDERMKAELIKRLLALATDGTPAREWKFKILSNLPLR